MNNNLNICINYIQMNSNNTTVNKDNKIIGKTAIDIEMMTLCFQSL